MAATGTIGEDGGSGGVAAAAAEAAAAEAVEATVPTALLLLVVGEPFTEELKETIVERITKELSSWDNEASGVDLNEELQVVAAKAPIGEDGQNGEKIVQHTSEKLHAEFLINPTLKTLTSKLHDFLLANGNYRQLIYSGQVLQHSGCWILQDGVFTLGNLAEIFRASAVSNAQRQRQAKGVLQLNVFTEGDWTESHLANIALQMQLQIRVNPPAQAALDSAGLIQFGAYLCCSLKVVSLKDLLQSSNVVGNIRFSRPTLYVFPSCQGDSALFGISGFNLLINGGFARKTCFWDFTRHLDRIDAMLLTHLGIDNLFGIQAVVARKAQETLHPEIGYVYMNAIERGKLSPGSEFASGLEGKKRNLILSVGDEASSLVEDMKAFGLYFPRPCTGVMQGANLAPINLYHKVGHGTLDMYILNPMQDSKTLKEFFVSWSKRGDGFTAKGAAVPLCHAASVCALLLWKPASSSDPVTRILFPGNATQGIIFEGLDRLKNVAVFQHSAGVEKDSKAALVKKSTPAKPQSAKPAPGKTPASAKQEPKKAPPPKKELQKSAGVPAKSGKSSDVEKKSTPSSKSKSPVDLKQPATSPEATSAASEGAVSEGGFTPDQEDNKENERGGIDADLLVDVQSVPSPVARTLDEGVANVKQEKPGPEEKDVDTKEGDTGDSAELLDAGGFGDVSPEGLPLPAGDDEASVRCSQPDENPSDCHSTEFDSERETEESVEAFDPQKHWGIPMDLPAPSKPPGKSSSSAKNDEAVGKKTSSTKPPASQQTGLRRETGKSEEPKDEDKGKGGGGDTSRKSSAAGIKKSRPSAAPNELHAKVDPKSAPRASAKRPAAAPTAVPASKPVPLKPVVPFYVDLTYIPGHGNSRYTDIDFFRRIRARYYVLSTVNPDAGVLTALLEAKQTWDDPELETTIIPTYDADVLRYWMAAHRDQLNQHRIDVAPSANRCSIQLQDHETSCAAYRLEF